MHDLPCILSLAGKEKKERDLEAITACAESLKIGLDKMASYTQLKAHTIHIYDKTGYSEDELRDYKKDNPIHVNFCRNQEKLGNGTFYCSICPQSRRYSQYRIREERGVLYYFIKTGSGMQNFYNMENKLFVSMQLIAPDSYYGRWPVLAFHKEIFSFLQVQFFTGDTISIDDFQAKFIGYLAGDIRRFSTEYSQDYVQLLQAFRDESFKFARGFEDISRDAFQGYMDALSVPYKDFIKNRCSHKPDKEEPPKIRNEKTCPRKQSPAPDYPTTTERSEGQLDKVTRDLQADIESLLAIHTSGKETPSTKYEGPCSAGDINIPLPISTDKVADAVPTAETHKNKDISQESDIDFNRTSYFNTKNQVFFSELKEADVPFFSLSLNNSPVLSIEKYSAGRKEGLVIYSSLMGKIYFIEDAHALNILSQIHKKQVFTTELSHIIPYVKPNNRIISVDTMYEVVTNNIFPKQDNSKAFLDMLSGDVCGHYSMLPFYERFYYALDRKMDKNQKAKFNIFNQFAHVLTLSKSYGDSEGYVKIYTHPDALTYQFKKNNIKKESSIGHTLCVYITDIDSEKYFFHKLCNRLFFQNTMGRYYMRVIYMDATMVILHHLSNKTADVKDAVWTTASMVIKSDEAYKNLVINIQADASHIENIVTCGSTS